MASVFGSSDFGSVLTAASTGLVASHHTSKDYSSVVAMGCGASAAPKAVAQETNVENAPLPNTDAIIEKPVQGVTDSEVVQGSPVQEPGAQTAAVTKVNVAAAATQGLAVESDVTSNEDDAKLAELRRKSQIVQGLADAALGSVGQNPSAAAGLVTIAASVAQDMPAITAAAVKTDIAAAAVGLAETAMSAASSGSATTEGLVMAAAATAVEAAQLRSKR
mmetsp:Transcript_128935/g.234239  ORF Transcript_128935/g.234239 Transcript_128935/m.234239 type:complete len:220 (-) Transcript_128935:357-1016(-)